MMIIQIIMDIIHHDDGFGTGGFLWGLGISVFLCWGGVLPHSQRHAVLRGLTGSMDRLLAVSMDHQRTVCSVSMQKCKKRTRGFKSERPCR